MNRTAGPSFALRLLLGFLWVFAFRTPSLAADFVPALTQYAHASWRVQDGDISGQANAIAQTRDGYLWVGTEAGLERYDGTHFRHWALPADKEVFALKAAKDGTLWVGQTNGLVHIKDGRAATLGVGQGRFNAIHEDAAGAIWLARTRGPANSGGLCELQGAGLKCFGPAEHQPCEFAATLTQNSRGDFWIGSSAGVCRWRPGSGELIKHDGHAPDVFGVQALAAQPDGSMLVGFMRTGLRLGLQTVSAQGSNAFMEGGLDGETLQVTALLRDRRGGLWIGTGDAGLYHVMQGRVDRFNGADGLSSNSVKAIYEDHEGSIWVATVGGVDRFHEHLVSAITTREGLITDNVASVLARRDGSIWISTTDGLNVSRDGVLSRIRAAEGLPGHTITSMLEDRAGKLWVGVDDNLTWYDGKSFHIVQKIDGSKLGVVVALAEDERHDVWVMTTGRPYHLQRIRNGRYLDEVHLPNDAFPTGLTAGPDGTIWVNSIAQNIFVFKDGLFEPVRLPGFVRHFKELVVLRNNDVVLASLTGAYYSRRGRWLSLDKARGLPCGAVHAIAEDRQGALWLRASCGLIIIAKADLERVLARPQNELKVRLLDGADGARPGNASFTPAIALSPGGRPWFATDGVLLTADPSQLPTNGLQPPVHVEQLIADHRTYPVGAAIMLPRNTRDVEIDYAGLSLYAPQKMHFRYRLFGVDDDWQDVGTRRAAFYMNLKPGRYRFQVIASNNDGVWNTTGDTVLFAIRPAFYQTLWFQACAAALVLALVWLALWFRVRSVTSEIENRLFERQSERIRIAQELHDTLLQGFQGLLVRFQLVADAIPLQSPAKSMMESVLNGAEDIIVEGRDRVRGLRVEEAESSPLLTELERIAADLERNGSLPIEVQSEGTPRRLEGDTQSEILMIAKEALTNAARHSQATAIFCRLRFTTAHVQLICGDNGIGLDPETMRVGRREGHWGLTGMRERARRIGGTFRVRSSPGETRVELSLNTYIAGLRRLGQWLPLWVSS